MDVLLVYLLLQLVSEYHLGENSLVYHTAHDVFFQSSIYVPVVCNPCLGCKLLYNLIFYTALSLSGNSRRCKLKTVRRDFPITNPSSKLSEEASHGSFRSF